MRFRLPQFDPLSLGAGLRAPLESELAKVVDVVAIWFHTATPALTEPYLATMDRLRADFPRIRFIYVTAGAGTGCRTLEGMAGDVFAVFRAGALATGRLAFLAGDLPALDFPAVGLTTLRAVFFGFTLPVTRWFAAGPTRFFVAMSLHPSS